MDIPVCFQIGPGIWLIPGEQRRTTRLLRTLRFLRIIRHLVSGAAAQVQHGRIKNQEYIEYTSPAKLIVHSGNLTMENRSTRICSSMYIFPIKNGGCHSSNRYVIVYQRVGYIEAENDILWVIFPGNLRVHEQVRLVQEIENIDRLVSWNRCIL